MTTVENATMIGKSVKINGELSGSEDLIMDGELHGTIRLAGARLTIGPAARVYGDIAAKDVVIFGRVDGDIRATGRLELRASAWMLGNIYAASLSIEENATVQGQIDPTRAQEPIPERPAVVASAPAKPVRVPAAAARPAAPAAVAAERINPAESIVAEPEEGTPSAPLFAETKA